MIIIPSKVILTAPHALCEIDEECDLKAIKFMTTIENEMRNKDIEVESYAGDIFRSIKDLNRKESSNTRFMEKVNFALSRLSKNEGVVIDVHSSPADIMKEKFEVFFLVIDDPKVNNNFTRDVCNYFKQLNLKCYIFEGSLDNYIIYRALFIYNIRRVMLIEINNMVRQPKMKYIASVLSDYINKI